MVSDTLIQQAADGDVEALVRLDAAGLLLGSDETAEAYADRLRCLRRNIESMEGDLGQQGSYSVEDMIVRARERIPRELFVEAEDITEAFFGFAIDWVPGFFVNPRWSLLFGGCAFFFYPDFFVLFIIRRAFATRQRWLIYSRRELLSHELCHVARIGLDSHLFEEMFAYQISTSAFRRVAGGVFHSPMDSLGFLGCTLLLLLAQFLRTLVLPGLPIWPFWALVVGLALFLLGRHMRLLRQLAAATTHASWLARDRARALLFRCTDGEVAALAGLTSEEGVSAWFDERCDAELRWRVIRQRFCQVPDGVPDQSAAPQAEAPGEPSA